MAYRELNLRVFKLDRNSLIEFPEQTLVQLFDLDSDFNGDNGHTDKWSPSNKLENGTANYIPLAIVEGYDTEAERLTHAMYDSKLSIEKNIDAILDHIKYWCFGSFATQFQYEIIECVHYYVIAISYLT